MPPLMIARETFPMRKSPLPIHSVTMGRLCIRPTDDGSYEIPEGNLFLAMDRKDYRGLCDDV